MFKTDRQSHGSPWYPDRFFIKMTMLLAWSTLHHSTAFTAVGKSNSVSVVGKGSMSDDEEKKGGIRAIFRGIKAKEESIFRVIKATKTVADKTFGLSTASYGLSLVAYGANFPTQMRVLTIANAGGFNKIRRASLAILKGAAGAAGTATIRSPSLAFATLAIANAKKRRQLAQQFESEHAAAMTAGTLSKEEYEKLKKLRRRQIKLETRAIRRIKSARNFFTRTVQNANLRQLQTILGDTVLMCTAIMASRDGSILGNYIYRWYTTLNMGNLFLEANKKIGFPLSTRVTESLYIFDTAKEDLVFDQPGGKSFLMNPITKFFLAKLPFTSHEPDDAEVAAEEAAFIRNVGAIVTYGIAVALNIYTPSLARKVNAALTASSLAVHGLSEFVGKNDGGESDIRDDGSTQPGLLKAGYGGQLTLGLTAVSLVMGYMLEHNKLYVPRFWTPMTVLDNYVDKTFELGAAILY